MNEHRWGDASMLPFVLAPPGRRVSSLQGLIALAIAFTFFSSFNPMLFAQETTQPQSSRSAAPISAPSTSGTAIESIPDLIKQLGADSFQIRQSAFDELVRVGNRAMPDLRKGLAETSDLEMIARIESLIGRLADQSESLRSKEFIRDIGSDDDHGFAAWTKFRSLAGSGRLGRQLMVEVYRHHPELADAIANSSASLQTLAESTVDQLVIKLRKGEALALGDSLAILFAFTGSDAHLGNKVEHGTYFCIKNSFELNSKLANKTWRIPLKPMLIELFARTDTLQNEAIAFAKTRDFSEATSLAKRVLSQPLADVLLFTASCRIISKHGTKEDIAVLLPWLEDETLLYRISTQRPKIAFEKDPLEEEEEKPTTYDCNAQDVALASCVVLAGLVPTDYLPRFRIDGNGWIQESSLGFPTDAPEMRTKAIEQFRAQSKEAQRK